MSVHKLIITQIASEQHTIILCYSVQGDNKSMCSQFHSFLVTFAVSHF